MCQILLLFFILLTSSLSPIFAQEDLTENLKERIKSAVTGTELQTPPPSTLVGYVGTITDVIQNSLVLSDKSGKKIIKLDDTTTLLRSPGNTAIELENVQVDDSIIAIGTPAGEDEIRGKRIIVSNLPITPPDKLGGYGLIEKVNRYSYTLTTLDSSPLELFFTSKTVYKSATEILEASDLAAGDSLLFTAVKDKDGDWSATVVMRLGTAASSSPPPPEEE